MEYHNPVLLKECIEGLNINPKGIYVDVTFGGGGHSFGILKELTTGKLFGFDQDQEAHENSLNDEKFVLIKGNFRSLKSSLSNLGIKAIDGLLADLGVSSHQFDSAERGFSIRFDAKLDMRMNQNEGMKAADILNEYDELKLKQIFKEFGEVENAGQVARKICEARKLKKIETTEELKEAIKKCVRKDKESRYLAKVFQALRIEVNDELNALKEMLEQVLEILKPEGRLVVISYHSLEDRLVKNFMRSGNFYGEVKKDFYGNPVTPFKLVTKKPIEPEEQEVNKNSRARSAKLRIAEKLNT